MIKFKALDLNKAEVEVTTDGLLHLQVNRNWRKLQKPFENDQVNPARRRKVASLLTNMTMTKRRSLMEKIVGKRLFYVGPYFLLSVILRLEDEWGT